MFKRYPLLIPLFAFVVGALVAGFYSFSFRELQGFILVAFILFILLAFIRSLRKMFVYFALFSVLGICTTTLLNDTFSKKHYSDTNRELVFYKGRLLDAPQKTKRSYRLEVELAEYSSDSMANISGKIFLYVPQDSALNRALPGDEILFQAKLKDVEPPANPHEFDYRNYLHLHQIYAQAYTRDYKITPQTDFTLKRTFVKIRKSLYDIIEKMNLEREERAVASALLLGYRHLLSDETQQAFSGAGAMHVLAVSGLHVGILYIFVAFILRLNHVKPHRNKWPKVLLAILIIWLYASLTGLSPSVSRAAVMFTFIAIGNLRKTKPSIYQSIISSALLLLIYNPNYLFEVGFQLSYCAVLGIVYLQPKIYSLYKPKYWVIDKVWQITAVSIAAQAATFPLSVYYFHQFPILFVFSNLIVIPTAWILMNYGLLLLLVSVFITPWSFLVLPFELVLKFMIWSVHFVESLPSAVVQGLSINRVELVLLMIFVVSLAETLWHRRKWALFSSASLIIVLFLSFSIQSILQDRQREITFYSIQKGTAIEIRDGKRSTLFLDEELLTNEDGKLFHIKHNLWAGGIKNLDEIDVNSEFIQSYFTKSNGLIDAFGQRILIYANESDSAKFTLNPDFVYVETGVFPPKRNPTNAQIILQNGHSRESKMQWRKYLGPVLDLKVSGALTADFNL